jgi:hypothetical protein
MTLFIKTTCTKAWNLAVKKMQSALKEWESSGREESSCTFCELFEFPGCSTLSVNCPMIPNMKHNLRMIPNNEFMRPARIIGDTVAKRYKESKNVKIKTKRPHIRPMTFSEDAVTSMLDYLEK